MFHLDLNILLNCCFNIKTTKHMFDHFNKSSWSQICFQEALQDSAEDWLNISVSKWRNLQVKKHQKHVLWCPTEGPKCSVHWISHTVDSHFSICKWSSYRCNDAMHEGVRTLHGRHTQACSIVYRLIIMIIVASACPSSSRGRSVRGKFNRFLLHSSSQRAK